jgi:hypothetical protein
VVATVVDSNGGTTRSASLSLVVDATVLGLPPMEGYILIGALVAGAAAVVAGVALARRRRNGPPPTGSP